jgi:hypothetical protein
MHQLRTLTLAALALAAASAPIGAYTGYYAPNCHWSAVWAPSG